jgi:CDGSH-type Zn-finger protein
MPDPTVTDNKPLRVELTEGEKYFYCTCGKSLNQPFCDGSHQGTGFAPMVITAEKTGPAFFCQCRNSSNAPFCDGTHSKIPEDQVGKEFRLSEDEA